MPDRQPLFLPMRSRQSTGSRTRSAQVSAKPAAPDFIVRSGRHAHRTELPWLSMGSRHDVWICAGATLAGPHRSRARSLVRLLTGTATVVWLVHVPRRMARVLHTDSGRLRPVRLGSTLDLQGIWANDA